MEHMKINDKSYLEHMIPHHQVAVDMSERLLLHTNHSYLMEFCRKLIVEQQGEIYYMNNFFMILGNTEKIPVLISIWVPLFVILMINSIAMIKINEK